MRRAAACVMLAAGMFLAGNPHHPRSGEIIMPRTAVTRRVLAILALTAAGFAAGRAASRGNPGSRPAPGKQPVPYAGYSDWITSDIAAHDTRDNWL